MAKRNRGKENQENKEKKDRAREEKGGRNGGGNAKRQAVVVNSEPDKVEKDGDRGDGKEKYGCAEGNRNE